MILPNIILCTDQSGGISHQGRIPWRCPEDMRFFRSITTEGSGPNLLVMGRNTLDSLNLSKWDLAVRPIALISSRPPAQPVLWFRTVDELYSELHPSLYRAVFICGGTRLYHEMLERPFGVVYHNIIEQDYQCDNRVDLSLLNSVPIISKQTDGTLTKLIRSHRHITSPVLQPSLHSTVSRSTTDSDLHPTVGH